MPVNLSIKNVPDALADKLRLNAQRNHRSLQKELLSVLERAAQVSTMSAPGARSVPGGRLSIEEAVRRARARFPSETPSSVAFIRQMRDRRYASSSAADGPETGPK